MRILVIGQASTHWGRKEFGNIGNYYVAESFFKELNRVFPGSEIRTTQQLTDEFCKRENVTCVPMELFYGWSESDVPYAYKELALAELYNETGVLLESTPFIEEVKAANIVVDFSGDMWGDNAELAGKNRFLVGLLKIRTAQLLGKKTAMICGSPGPFKICKDLLPFAKKVYDTLDLVTNREPESRKVLEQYGFNISKVHNLACPAFLFNPAEDTEISIAIKDTVLEKNKRPVIGFMLCGWNMLQGPFSRTDWKDEEYNNFMEVILHMVKSYDVDICLMSHSNGFKLPPNFELIHGRDYQLTKQLYEILKKTEVADRIHLMDGIYLPKETFCIVNKFDMLISGRVHGAIAAIAQAIPTTIIDYGHEPKAHKLKGFATLLDMQHLVSDPHSAQDMILKASYCWENRIKIHEELEAKLPEVRNMARENFDLLKTL